MIKGIDVSNFGCFKNFEWSSIRDEGNNIAHLKKLTFIYGRNYSGKTTLSRIARCLETGNLPNHFLDPRFSVAMSTAGVSQSQIPSADHVVRVYNRDFVEEHLSVLRAADGHMTPFAVLGSENVELSAKLAELAAKLGGAETQTGLQNELEVSRAAEMEAWDVLKREEAALKNALSKKALTPPRGIKHNTRYNLPNYNVPRLEADIAEVRGKKINALPEGERRALERQCDEVALATVDKLKSFTGSQTSITERANRLLTRNVKPTNAITALLSDAQLQSWVKEGIAHHKGKRDVCGFCSNQLPSHIWERLDQHFNQDSEQLIEEIDAARQAIAADRLHTSNLRGIDHTAVYASLHADLSAAHQALSVAVAAYVAELDAIDAALVSRRCNPFESHTQLTVIDRECAVRAALEQNNTVATACNEKTKSLEEDQRTIKQKLRLSEVAEFLEEVSFTLLEANVSVAKESYEAKRSTAENLAAQIREIEGEVLDLQSQLKDERRGAQAVNALLESHFGHESLRLVAEEDSPTSGYKFKIKRGSADAHNLSEGECSLVALCYFLAKLDDVDSRGKQKIVWIDDPISSLDSNHIFFVFSLLESRIAAPVRDETGANKYRYEQLVVATHNLEFLKYLKRLSIPKVGQIADVGHFVVYGSAVGSVVRLMPRHLREYVTEFNYLFGELCVCADPMNVAAHHNSFYNFGNNLRKFLEAYLYFKYPTANDTTEREYNARVTRFFASQEGAETFVQRLSQEYSHLAGLERAAEPNDKDEIAKLARFVLLALRKADRDQYQSLLASVGCVDPLPS